jgi:hypothetical protein
LSNSKVYWYKIVDRDDEGNLKTLYHGVNKSKILKFNRWLTAENKIVKDGSGKTRYLSGFHLLSSLEDCLDYLKLFRRISNKAIVKCKAKKIRPKKHSKKSVFMADKIIIKEVVEL